MSFIRHKSTGLMLPGLAIAALLALVTSALPGSAATARPAAAESCGTMTPVFFGLHGMGEGPSLNISAVSPELESFDTDQNAISGAVGAVPVSYTTVYPNAWGIAATLFGGLYNGEWALQDVIKAYTKGCSASQDKIALVGYSMGAWVINKWIMDHPQERAMIKAVVLYGDPCWVHGNDQGLARLFLGGFGCMPAADYPYPAPNSGARMPPVQSWSMPHDPVSGWGWAGHASSKNKNAQFQAAQKCTDVATCTHLDYTGSTEIYEGAQFVVAKLVG